MRETIIIALLIIGIASVGFAFPAATHLSGMETMMSVPLAKGGFENLLDNADLEELQKIIDEKGLAGGDHRNNGSHDPSILEKRLERKGWPSKKIAAAKNALHIHNLQDISSKYTKVGDLINGHKVTYFDKIIAKYKLWRIKHGWGYKPYGKYKKAGFFLKPLNISDFRYKLNLKGSEILEPKVGKFSTIMKAASKWAIVIGILYEGYSATKEVYQMKMAGEKVHPSRVLVRACFGFAGAIAGGIVLSALLAWIPLAGIIIGGLGGGLLGAVLSEQLFELIMPSHTTNWMWIPLDLILGGVLGSVLGIIFGIPYGFRKGLKRIKPPRKFTDRILSPITAPVRILSSTFDYTIMGFFLGGFSGSMLMLIGFTFM